MKIKTSIRSAILFALAITNAAHAEPTNLTLRSIGPLAHTQVSKTISSLGTNFEVTPDTVVSVDDDVVGVGIGAIRTIPNGEQMVVSLYGTDLKSPLVAVRFATHQRYTEGSTPVLLHDTVKWVRPELARVKVGQTVVDYSAALATQPDLAFKVGDEVLVNGTWPSPTSPLLATKVSTGSASAAGSRNLNPGISGSGFISGGISGSGIVSTGISGSGTKAQARPTMSAGISGSGVISSGISGSGVISTGISGSGVKSAARPGISAGISGSGAVSNGISGSGLTSTGISGSGAKSTSRSGFGLGISGSGVISTGISGSGVVSTGISGSGAKALARPVTTLGISGSGVISQGISGSGVISTGISGSGHN